MPVDGFVEYRKREFCNDAKCPVQLELNKHKDEPEEYERVRQTCSKACRYTAWQFHHWLIDRGYLILKSKRSGET